jgi:hypothetical protein
MPEKAIVGKWSVTSTATLSRISRILDALGDKGTTNISRVTSHCVSGLRRAIAQPLNQQFVTSSRKVGNLPLESQRAQLTITIDAINRRFKTI